MYPMTQGVLDPAVVAAAPQVTEASAPTRVTAGPPVAAAAAAAAKNIQATAAVTLLGTLATEPAAVNLSSLGSSPIGPFSIRFDEARGMTLRPD